MKLSAWFGGACLMALPGLSLALPPSAARDYSNVPQGYTALQYIYQGVNTNSAFNLPQANPQLDASINISTLRYIKYFDRAGHTSAFSIFQSYGDLDGSLALPGLGTSVPFSGHGFADTVVIVGTNLTGGPYLPMQEFAAAKPAPFITAQMMVSIPTGDYDSEKLFNLGTNRWVIKPEVAFVRPLGQNWWWDTYANVELYGENDDPRGGNSLKTKPLYGLDSHISYTVNRGIWVSAGLNYRNGGANRLDGVSQGGSTEYSNGVLAANMNFSPNWSMKAIYMRPIDAANDDVDTKTFQLTVQYSWGFMN